jgi:hypothetical protein
MHIFKLYESLHYKMNNSELAALAIIEQENVTKQELYFEIHGLCNAIGCMNESSCGWCVHHRHTECMKKSSSEDKTITWKLLKAVAAAVPGQCAAMGCLEEVSVGWGHHCSRSCRSSRQRFDNDLKIEVTCVLHRLGEEIKEKMDRWNALAVLLG